MKRYSHADTTFGKKGAFVWMAIPGTFIFLYATWIFSTSIIPLYSRGEVFEAVLSVICLLPVIFMVVSTVLMGVYGLRTLQRLSIKGDLIEGISYYGTVMRINRRNILSIEKIDSSFIKRIGTPVSYGDFFFRLKTSSGKHIYIASTMSGISDISDWLSKV